MNYFQINESSLLIQGEYSLYLVLLSVAIAIFASFMAFQVANQASDTKCGTRRQISIFIGSIALGGGVWSMHFIGMLAFILCTDVTYGWEITMLSFLPAIGASWVALQFLTKDEFKISQLLLSGTLMGLGIGSMHYIGMAAMEMAPLLRYDLPIFTLSIFVAAFFSCVSLKIKSRLQGKNKFNLSPFQQNIIASIVMGMAISGMHYTGMASARFVLPPGFELTNQTNEISTYLALGISIITITIIAIVLFTTLIFKYKDMTAVSVTHQKRLAATINTSIDGIITTDANGMVISMNSAIEKMLGWTEEDLLNKSIQKLIPPDHDALKSISITEYLRHRKATIDGRSQTLEVLSRSGDRVPIRLGLGHVELDNQDLFVGYLSDLRVQLKMEQALKENEAKLRSLVSNIPGIVYRCLNTNDRPLVFVNDEIEQVVGYPASDFLIPTATKNFAEFVHEDDIGDVLAAIDATDDQFSVEYRLIDKFGNTKWMLGYGRKIFHGVDNTPYIDGFIMDITPRKIMEDALVVEKNNAQKAAEARAAFMANMSHEIRTPMNAIIGFSDILLEEKMSNEQHKFITTIHQSAQSLLHILNDILDSAKLDKGELALESRPFSIVATVDSVISTLGLQAKKKGIELVLNVAGNIPESVSGSAERIRQILINIVGNAVKFTHQGKVEIIVSADANDMIKFDIVDGGIGMKPEQLEKMFEPFVQADASMSRKYGGTGLGTTISKQLIELMKGKITASSQYGCGTTVSIVLPLPESNQDVSSSISIVHQAIRDIPALSILVADDVQQNLELLTLILSKVGHQVVCVTNGELALAKMSEQPFDLVLMDVQMPVLDGLSASKQRRQLESMKSLPRIPIIALTASVLENDRLAAQEAGMDSFINKPIIPKVLFAEIQRVTSDTQSQPILREIECTNSTINLAHGVDLWGDEITLYDEINKFLSTTTIIEVLIGFEQADISVETVAGDLHKARGIAGNLGLEVCFKQLALLEKSVLSGELDSLNEMIQQLSSDLESAKVLIEKSREVTQGASHEGRTESKAAFMTKLLILKNMIEQSTFNDKVLNELLTSAPHEYEEQLSLIAELCNDFEFSRATEEINTILIELDH